MTPCRGCATASSATTRFNDIRNYIKRGKLWDAFAADRKVVLLIDEIDKADIEFPNDLLQELDRMEFFVYETGETIRAAARPIVIITSNNEKELPDAFLRRCFFHYIRFPDAETLTKIVEVHYPGIKQNLVRAALTQFYEIREVPGLKKKPSTSEALDWIRLLVADDIDPADLRADPKNALPKLHGALLKNEQDVHLFERLAFMARLAVGGARTDARPARSSAARHAAWAARFSGRRADRPGRCRRRPAGGSSRAPRRSTASSSARAPRGSRRTGSARRAPGSA